MTINGQEVQEQEGKIGTVKSYTPGNKYEFNSKDIVSFQLLDPARSKGQFLNVICRVPATANSKEVLIARRITVTELAKILASMDLALTAQKQLMYERVELKKPAVTAPKGTENLPEHVQVALS